MSTPHLFLVLSVSILIGVYATFSNLENRWNWVILAILLAFMSGGALAVRLFSQI